MWRGCSHSLGAGVALGRAGQEGPAGPPGPPGYVTNSNAGAARRPSRGQATPQGPDTLAGVFGSGSAGTGAAGGAGGAVTCSAWFPRQHEPPGLPAQTCPLGNQPAGSLGTGCRGGAGGGAVRLVRMRTADCVGQAQAGDRVWWTVQRVRSCVSLGGRSGMSCADVCKEAACRPSLWPGVRRSRRREDPAATSGARSFWPTRRVF